MKKFLLSIIYFLVCILTGHTQILYGTTFNGGNSFGGGTISKFIPATNVLTVAYSFGSIASKPLYTHFIQASDGKLYGMTSEGGSGNYGVIFSFDPSAATYTRLHDFDNINGAFPNGSLMQANDGKFYGMTNGGGSNDVGVIFSFDPSSSTYVKLKDFSNTDGARPYGSLIQASDGKLYGTTNQGGGGNLGTIFSFDPSTSNYTKLVDFDYTKGVYPAGSLIEASDGKLYGMTTGDLLFNALGQNPGAIFSFDPSSSVYTKLKDFGSVDGDTPLGSLIQASDGKLYGMTSEGGILGAGVTFSFDPSSSTYTKKDFGNNNGENPEGSLVQASDGRLYGMTLGGSNFDGVIFSFDPSTSTYTKVKDLDDTTGAHPFGSLIQLSDGKLYGMTSNGGTNGFGVIFSFDPSTSTYTKLKEFDFANGASPSGSLMQASNGKLYGMTNDGGSNRYGVIFSFDPSSSIYTKLKDFDNTNGARPFGSLIQANDGKLYGMTYQGGNFAIGDGAGVIFSFDPSSSTYTNLKEFDFFDGANPFGSLMQASDGKLYGMTYTGGASPAGVIFSYDPSSSTYTKLMDFDTTNGAGPRGTLMQASDGKLYGTTHFGGSSDAGVIFSFDPSTSTYTKLKDYNGVNGANPDNGSAFIEVKECIADITYYQDADGDGYGNPTISIKACTQRAGYVTDNTDCDDSNAAIHAPVTYYRDADGDGYGDANISISVCESTPPVGYVNNNYDCDDYDKLKKEGNERVVMCHNGKPECVIAKEIRKRLEKGWTLGPCTPALTTIDAAENVETYAKEQSIPRQYKLSNYPNPFKGTSTIQYQLPFDSKVSIKVYDLMGRVLATLVNGDKKAGTYTIDFNGGNLSKGSLYYRIIATSKDQQFEQTNKMIQIQ